MDSNSLVISGLFDRCRCGDGARLIAVDKHDVAFVEVPERGIRAVERSECRDRLCVPLARAISTARASICSPTSMRMYALGCSGGSDSTSGSVPYADRKSHTSELQ